MAELALHVLGELSVRAGGRDTVVAARRERAVLAVLLAAHGAPVRAEQVIDAVWGESPPAQAGASLQVAVSRLRQLLEPDRAPRSPARLLLSTTDGYQLRLPDEVVDARRFTGLATAASDPLTAPTDRLALAEQAFALWRGSPYPGVAELPGVAEEVGRLTTVHLGLLEGRAQALLEVGRHDLVADELPSLVAHHPFRERLWAVLALAQYRCDRQADALSTLRRLRAALVDELGVDPSQAVRDLEADVLAQATHLAAPTPADGAAGAGTVPTEPRHADSRPIDSRPTGARPTEQAVAAVPQPRAAQQRPPLVVEGREDALAAVSRALDRLGDGAGGVLLLSGEPGIGKSVLADELAVRAGRAGVRVLWGRCHEADVAPAYWPWLPVLRAVAGPDPDPTLATLVATTSDPHGSVGGDSADLRTYDAASRALRAAALQQPLLVLLEDIHWADTSSLRLLAYAAERLADVPLLLALTRRTVDAPHPPALATALAALSRLGAVRVSLRGLRPGGIARLVEGVVGRPAPELAQALGERTDGNPFFVLEMARLLAARGATQASDATDLDVPDGVRDVLRLRVDRLSEAQQRVLGVASVAGRDIDPGLVAQVLGVPLDAVLDDLDDMVAAGVVHEDTGRYRFTHALTRETVYAGLPPSRRLRRHADVARVLEGRLAHDPELVADVAHHYRTAARSRPDLVAVAVDRTMDAARLARARGAGDEARELCSHALEVSALAPAPDPVVRHGLLVGLATAQLHTSDLAGARTTVEEAVALARSIERWDLVAVAATSFRNAGVWHWREFGDTDTVMIDNLHRCLDHVAESPLRARVLACLQIEYMYGWHLAEADRYGREAVDLARRCGDPAVLVDTLRQRLNALWGPGGGRERIDLALEALGLAGDDTTRVYLGFELGAAYHQTGQPELADEAMGRAMELAAGLRHTSADVPLAWWRFMRAYERGDPAAASIAEEALALHRRTSVVAIREATGLVSVRLAPDGADVAPDVVAGARTAGNPAYRATIAQALALAGHPDEAVALLGDGAPDGARDYAKLAADCLRVDTLATAGRTDLLPAALVRIEPWLDEVATYGSIDALGSVRYFAGRGAEALGDLPRARAHYELAVAHDARIGNVPWGRRAAQRLAGFGGVGAAGAAAVVGGKSAASRR